MNFETYATGVAWRLYFKESSLRNLWSGLDPDRWPGSFTRAGLAFREQAGYDAMEKRKALYQLAQSLSAEPDQRRQTFAPSTAQWPQPRRRYPAAPRPVAWKSKSALALSGAACAPGWTQPKRSKPSPTSWLGSFTGCSLRPRLLRCRRTPLRRHQHTYSGEGWRPVRRRERGDPRTVRASSSHLTGQLRACAGAQVGGQPRSIKSPDLDCGRRFIPEDLVPESSPM